MTGRGRRKLTPEDKALWSHVVRDVTPLDPARAADLAVAAATAPELEAKPARRPVRAAKAAEPLPPPPAPPPLAPIEKRLRQRLSRGQMKAEARLDLHGLTQDAAHHRLVGFLRRAQADGLRLVIVITGKGASKQAVAFDDPAWGDGGRRPDPHGGRGVLRRVVPLWLTMPELRTLVIGFEEAAVGHGGAGALYVRIRRP